jgi:hypothetical protein
MRAGRRASSTIPGAASRARATAGQLGGSTGSTCSILGFSASRRARRRKSIRSSDCCWNLPGTRWRMPAFPPAGSRAPRPAFISAPRRPITATSGSVIRRAATLILRPERRSAYSPTASHTSSICAARAWWSIPPARRRWSRCTRRARRCAPAASRAPWSAASICCCPRIRFSVSPRPGCCRGAVAVLRSMPVPMAMCAAKAAPWCC